MSTRAKRWVLSVGGLTMVAIVAFSVFVLVPGDPRRAAGTAPPSAPALTAQEVGLRYLDAFARGDVAAAAASTTAPEAAEHALAQVRSVLRPTAVRAEFAGPVQPAPGAAEVGQRVSVAWTLGPDRVWSYATALTLVLGDGRWRVRWDLTAVHPELATGRALTLLGGPEEAVLDRGGAPLMVRRGAAVVPADPAVAPLLTSGIARVVEARGAPPSRVALVDAAGAELATLFAAPAGDQAPLKSTVDIGVQRAAQAAVDAEPRAAHVVALDVDGGGILAVAQNAAAGAAPSALTGLYPPGSAFKVVTAAAALEAGLATPDTALPCPGSATIGARTIRNADFELGDVPLRTAFAQSCNTTFASLAAELPLDALPGAAAEFGLAADFDIPGITTHTGRVPASAGVVEQVENSIGQGRVQASPFGMALVAATVAKGAPVTPRLFADLDTVVDTGYRAPSVTTAKALRGMMRQVVTSGRATELARHGAVAGKTGTAQFGDGSRAHGWFVGYRGGVAFAVLVEDAGAAAAAVAVTGRFLASSG